MNAFFVFALLTVAAASETRDKRGLVGEALLAPGLHAPLLGYDTALLGSHALHAAPLLNSHLASPLLGAHSLHSPLLGSSLYSPLYGHGSSLYSPLYGHGSSLYSPLHGYGYGYASGLHSPLLSSSYLGSPLLTAHASPLLAHASPALTVVKTSSVVHSNSNGHGKQGSEH